ncbi:hypothetical protein AYJ54_29630 [Bradyrhizobium centrolobii]|uniref:Polysaccharide chain length determinant N-terminal domain-containing protein n=1 Tax=Bradyrhizobium centrolobii TaxID=1505087 RepID=A0A176YC97_9BRAD|nr:hypothetical protein [Bradyrhizobium centrolobii]OAF01238.1 hypothetical protein AYJ54_29630 [Bradyrhizobium centrolobii]
MNDTSASISSVDYVGGMLGYLGQSVRARLRLIVLGTLIAMLVVFVVDRTRPAVYSAEATMQLGRVDGADVMPMQSTVLHMNSAPFRRRVAEAIGSAGGGDKAEERLFDNFTVRPQTSDLASLTVNGPSEQRTTEALQAILRTLNADQEKLRLPVLEELNTQMALIDANVASLMKVRETLASMDAVAPSSSTDPASLALRRVWLLDLVSRNEDRLAVATSERRALATRIGPSKTYPATLGDDVTIRQVSPRPFRYAAFAGAIALLALLLYAMMSKPRRARMR